MNDVSQQIRALGLSLLLLIAMWPRLAPLWERIGAGFPAIDLRDAQELRMINPRYTGVDRHGRPFVVTAAVGRQVPLHQDLMSLQRPRAELMTHGGTRIVVTARTGIYQQPAQLLDLFGQVTLVHQNGTRFITDRARVNGARETAEGAEPVVGHGPSGDVKAQGFRVLDKGDRIIFTGKSDMLLRAARPVPANTTPAALPAPVAAAAAQIAAEAGSVPIAHSRRQATAHERRRYERSHRRPAHARHRAAHASGRS
jgi:lipopolysaccharide export system protein LptC